MIERISQSTVMVSAANAVNTGVSLASAVASRYAAQNSL